MNEDPPASHNPISSPSCFPCHLLLTLLLQLLSSGKQLNNMQLLMCLQIKIINIKMILHVNNKTVFQINVNNDKYISVH